VQEACSFSGAWRGKPRGMQRVYYVSSYFWDRALESGIIDDKAAIEWKTSPAVSASGITHTVTHSHTCESV
jgi:apyrase